MSRDCSSICLREVEKRKVIPSLGKTLDLMCLFSEARGFCPEQGVAPREQACTHPSIPAAHLFLPRPPYTPRSHPALKVITAAERDAQKNPSQVHSA